jgi:hypothetical protein
VATSRDVLSGHLKRVASRCSRSLKCAGHAFGAAQCASQPSTRHSMCAHTRWFIVLTRCSSKYACQYTLVSRHGEMSPTPSKGWQRTKIWHRPLCAHRLIHCGCLSHVFVSADSCRSSVCWTAMGDVAGEDFVPLATKLNGRLGKAPLAILSELRWTAASRNGRMRSRRSSPTRCSSWFARAMCKSNGRMHHQHGTCVHVHGACACWRHIMIKTRRLHRFVAAHLPRLPDHKYLDSAGDTQLGSCDG